MTFSRNPESFIPGRAFASPLPPKVGAVCLNGARTDLCGWRGVTRVPCTLQIAWRINHNLLSSEENGEPLASLWQMSPCGRLGPVFQALLFRLDGILGRA